MQESSELNYASSLTRLLAGGFMVRREGSVDVIPFGDYSFHARFGLGSAIVK